MSTQLPQVLIRNSFNILGLSSSAALNEIRKRSLQLLQLAKIEEIQEFEIDIGHVREFRNESEVRLALERISGIKERLKEIFFWFDDHNIENQKAIALISKEKYSEALDILKQTDKTSIDWLETKNLALALMFQAFVSAELNSFCLSLELWKRIADSEDFWRFYEKHYMLHDEFGTSSSLFQEFRSSICESISAKVVCFYHQTRNPESIGIYYSIFAKIGTSIDVQLLQPIVLKIKKEIEDLEKIGSESVADEKSEGAKSLIKLALKKIDKYFLELDKFDLSAYSPLIVLKDDSAEKLRSISVDIYNQNDNTELALLFIEQSAKLAVSATIVSKIESDKRQIKENQLWKTISIRFDKIKELVAHKKLKEAKREYFNLDTELMKEDEISSFTCRINLLTDYCALLVEKGHEFFGKKMFGIKILAIDGFLNQKNQKYGIQLFEYTFEILNDRLDLLNFATCSHDQSELSKRVHKIFNSKSEELPPLDSPQACQEALDKISSLLKNCELSSLLDNQQACLDKVFRMAEKQEDRNTQVVIKLLGIALCYSILYRRVRGVAQKKMWKWVGWGAVITYYILAIMDKSESKPSQKNSNRANSSYYTTSSPSLTPEEKKVIVYLQKNKPDALRDVRKQGFSDKQIAHHLIDHANDEDE